MDRQTAAGAPIRSFSGSEDHVIRLDERLKRVLRECAALSRDHLGPGLGHAPEGGLLRMAEDLRFFSQVWTMEICLLLRAQEVLRFNQLNRSLRGIGSRTLTDRLKRLQVADIVQRTHYDENPPHVDYRLTERGHAHVHLAFAQYLNAGRR